MLNAQADNFTPKTQRANLMTQTARTVPSRQTIAEYISRRIDQLASKKTQKEIAKEIGYDKPNIISMWKAEDTKVPIDKIPALAKVLDVDPANLFRLALKQYWPEDAKIIADLFGAVVSQNELAILETIRKATKNADPTLTPAMAAKLKEIFRA